MKFGTGVLAQINASGEVQLLNENASIDKPDVVAIAIFDAPKVGELFTASAKLFDGNGLEVGMISIKKTYVVTIHAPRYGKYLSWCLVSLGGLVMFFLSCARGMRAKQ